MAPLWETAYKKLNLKIKTLKQLSLKMKATTNSTTPLVKSMTTRMEAERVLE